MTEKIDLDELDVESDDEETPNRGDWFWRDDGDPVAEPVPPDDASAGDPAGSSHDASGAADEGDTGTDESAGDAEGETSPPDTPVPHVPRKDKDKPVGIPTESGGAGGGKRARADPPDHTDTDDEAASGPHGGGVDDMTLAVTYSAMKRFEEPQHVTRDAKAWADWLGIVGDVEAFVINKFQRDHTIDADFFSGSGQSAAERLADIDNHSMFYAERMVVVGLPEEEALAEQVGWEFIPLSEAATEAGWEVADGDD